MTAAFSTFLSVFCHIFMNMTEIYQCVFSCIYLENNIAASSAVPAVTIQCSLRW